MQQLTVLLASVLYSSLLPMLSAFMPTCHQPNFTCPNSPVSCDCQGFVRLLWSVSRPVNGSEQVITRIGFGPVDSIGAITTILGYTALVCNVTGDGEGRLLVSKLNFTLSEPSIHVDCADRSARGRVSLQAAGKRIIAADLCMYDCMYRRAVGSHELEFHCNSHHVW